jgi:NitT/TauT family transport system ATP-binding protein
MISIEALSFYYPNGQAIFKDFNWQIQAGEVWSVLGPSGCGKTTLLYLLAGLRRPANGQIAINGALLTKPRPCTGLILQDYGLLPWATLQENIALGLRVRQFYGPDGKHAPSDETVQDIPGAVEHWVERLGLSGVAKQYPGQVSGGQRQRAAIARSLVLRPDLLLMDEPFASLDAPTRQSLQSLLLELRAETTLTLVIVTHAIEEAVFLGQKILLLSRPPNPNSQVFENPSAGQPGFLDSEDYRAQCARLRRALEQSI